MSADQARGRDVRHGWWLGFLALACQSLAGCGVSTGVSPSGRAAAAATGQAEEESPDAPLPFRLPEGYSGERVAGSPLIVHPMFACFDDRGRLYVAGSSGHNLDGNALKANPADVIRRLEDTDGDGRYDRSTVFADRLTYPQGVLWHDGSVYTASPPSLWRLEDTDGDGVADRRTELVTGFPFTGIADDLHGPNLGPDGRIYWGVGRFDYAIRKPGGPLIAKGNTPLVMRCRPDGGEVEVYSAAMGNPVEVAFSAEGEPFACGTFLSPEAQGEGLRDAIIHCVYGGLYSVRDRDLSAQRHTGDLLPPLAQLGVAAGSGLTFARGGPFGSSSRPELYAAMFNLHSVTHHVLKRDGSTFRAAEEPFLQSDVTDFHPTDVLEDADGSLLVVDTGGWFRSCPTSQVAKANVRGGIYRIRRTSSGRTGTTLAARSRWGRGSTAGARRGRSSGDPWGAKLDWEDVAPADLAERLKDARFAVRDRAAAALARQAGGAVPALQAALHHGRSRVRVRALWVASRVDGAEAREAAREALGDDNPGVRLAAATAAGLHRDAGAADRLGRLVRSDESPAVRREAATALGRIGRADDAPALLDGLRAANDRFLDHALVYGLIELGNRAATLAALGDPGPRVRRGALVALDQMTGGGLTLDLVTPFLADPDPDLRREALRVVSGHPEWAGGLAGTLKAWLSEAASGDRPRDLRPQLRAFASDPAVRQVIAEALGAPKTPAATRRTLLEVIASVPSADWPPAWDSAVGKALHDADEGVVRQAVAAVAASGKAGFEAVLLGLAVAPAGGDDLRVAAAEVAAPALAKVEPALFSYLLARLGPDEPPVRRLAAARALGRARLDDAQLLTMARAGKATGPMVLTRVLPAYGRSRDPAVGSALVASLADAPGLIGLSGAEIEQAIRGFPASVRRQAEPLFERLSRVEGDRESRLAAAETQLAAGNSARGREVFFGTRAACSTCHVVRAEGGHVGPDLTRIGLARNGRDFLEAILYPSASFARGYEPFIVATDDGLVHTGIIARETGDSIVMVTPDRLETAIPRSTIEAITPAGVSVMPQGLDANLRPGELSDLVAFLQSLK